MNRKQQGGNTIGEGGREGGGGGRAPKESDKTTALHFEANHTTSDHIDSVLYALECFAICIDLYRLS